MATAAAHWIEPYPESQDRPLYNYYMKLIKSYSVKSQPLLKNYCLNAGLQ